MAHHEYQSPLLVQRAVIPYIQHFNADMIVKAQTGSGKLFLTRAWNIQLMFSGKTQRSKALKDVYLIVFEAVVGFLLIEWAQLLYQLFDVAISSHFNLYWFELRSFLWFLSQTL
jgi:hypothetical protein